MEASSRCASGIEMGRRGALPSYEASQGVGAPLERVSARRWPSGRTSLIRGARSSLGVNQWPSWAFRRDRRGLFGKMQMHLRMHRIEPIAFAVVHENAAGFVRIDGQERIVGILLPVNEVGGRRDVRAPQALLRAGTGAAVIVGVITA